MPQTRSIALTVQQRVIPKDIPTVSIDDLGPTLNRRKRVTDKPKMPDHRRRKTQRRREGGVCYLIWLTPAVSWIERVEGLLIPNPSKNHVPMKGVCTLTVCIGLLVVPCAGFVLPSATYAGVRRAHVRLHATETLDPANAPKDKIPEDEDLADDPKTRELLRKVTRAELIVNTVDIGSRLGSRIDNLSANLNVYAIAFFFSFIIFGILGFVGYSDLSKTLTEQAPKVSKIDELVLYKNGVQYFSVLLGGGVITYFLGYLPAPQFEGLKNLLPFLFPDKKQNPDEKGEKKVTPPPPADG